MLTNNAGLDMAIGLILLYLVLSLACTVINEFISTSLGLRASTLRGALDHILDVETLKRDFYDHGLINGTNAAIGNHMSYLGGRTFAGALLASLDPTKPLTLFADLESTVQKLPDSNIRDALLVQLQTANGDLEK